MSIAGHGFFPSTIASIRLDESICRVGPLRLRAAKPEGGAEHGGCSEAGRPKHERGGDPHARSQVCIA